MSILQMRFSDDLCAWEVGRLNDRNAKVHAKFKHRASAKIYRDVCNYAMEIQPVVDQLQRVYYTHCRYMDEATARRALDQMQAATLRTLLG